MACMEMSILEIFGNGGAYDEATDLAIANLSDEEVLDAINSVDVSGIFLTPFNFTTYLSRVRRDVDGRIIGAEATIMYWLGKHNMTEAKRNPAPGRGEPIDPRILDWEGDMLEIMLNTTGYPDGLASYANVARSFGDIAGSTILGDVSVFVIGYSLMFQYATIMLGKLSCVQHRTFLATIGILGVMMGIIVSFGVCSAAGIFYGPMHSVLPFLMLGIGIDDMFVIVQCWDTLPQEKRIGSLEQRFGFLMRQAGAAITVTSVTDVVAFGVGAFTILPALKSFCIYAAVGIIATFIFQASFFVAWMSLDQRRIESNRNGCCPCYVHPQPAAQENASSTSILQKGFRKLANFMMKPPVKICVILFTLVLTGVGVFGNILLRQEFDPTWFLPQDTYIAQWFANNKLYFPSSGERGTIYFSNTSLPQDIPVIGLLADQLENQTDIVEEVDSWTQPFLDYTNLLGYNVTEDLNQTSFKSSLTHFLFSPVGAKYVSKFKFDGELKCGEPAPDILLSEITYTHR